MGEDGQGDICANQALANFVDGTITARNRHNMATLRHSFLGQSHCMTGILADNDVEVISAVVKMLMDLFGQILPVVLASNRIEDESYLLLVHAKPICQYTIDSI